MIDLPDLPLDLDDAVPAREREEATVKPAVKAEATPAATGATAAQAFLGILLYTAKNFALEALEPIRDALGMVSGEMFDGADLELYHAMVDLTEQGHAPTLGTIQRLALPAFDHKQASAYLKQHAVFGDIYAAAKAVTAEHERATLTDRLARALEATKRGKLDIARALVADVELLAPSRASHAAVGFEDYQFNPHGDPRIPLPWPSLTEKTGGGLGYQGRSTMSLWVFDTGVGKSTIMQQCTAFWLERGHWVVYFAGEASEYDVRTEIIRLFKRVPYSQLEYAKRKPLPALTQTMQDGARELHGMRGRLIVEDDDFDGGHIRTVARGLKRQLEEARKNGDANADAQLIVIVDNIDSAIQFDLSGRAREDQIYDREARRFELDSKKHEYHIAMLSQTNDDGRKRQGPPEKTDVARAKVLVTRVSTMITGHRPITPSDLAATERLADGTTGPGKRARHWLFVAKARGGKAGSLIEMDSNPNTGAWFDPNEPAF